MTATNGHIVQVDPETLSVSSNVRTETTIDDAFVNSIKEHGILQPPMVTKTDNGTYEIVFGHRRTAAAIKAGLTSIDVYVVDQHEAEAARIIDQLTENDQRQQLTNAERVGGYKTLALIGLSPAQIAKRTATNRKTVDTSLAIADNETAVTALTEHQLTLDQAAELVDFSDDALAIKNLTTAAARGPLDFDRAVITERANRHRANHKLALAAQLEHEGTTRLKDAAYWETHDGYTSIKNLALAATPTERLTPEDVIGKPGTAATISQSYDADGSTLTYFVNDELIDSNGYVPIGRAEPEQTDEQRAANEEQRARKQAQDELRDRLKTTAEARRNWLTNLIQRPKLPTDASTFTMRMLILVDAPLLWELDDLTLVLAGLTPTETHTRRWETQGIPANNKIALAALEGSPKVGDKLLFALALTRAEGTIDNWAGQFYSDNVRAAAIYLDTLLGWGYELDNDERAMLDDAIKSVAELDHPDEIPTDDEDEDDETDDDQ